MRPVSLLAMPLTALAFVARCGVSASNIAAMLGLLLAKAVNDALSAVLLAGTLAMLMPSMGQPSKAAIPLASISGNLPGGGFAPIGWMLLMLVLCKAVLAPALVWLRGQMIDGWTLHVSMTVFARILQPSADASALTQGQGSNVAVNHVVPRVMSGTILPSLDLLTELVVVSVILVVLMSREPLATLMLVLALSLGVGISAVLSRHLGAGQGAGRVKNQALMQRWVADSIACLRELHLYRRSPAVLDRFRPVARRYAKLLAFERTFTDVQAPIMELLFLVALCGTIMLASRSWHVDLPLLALFSAMGLRLIPGFRRIVSSLQLIDFSRPYFHHLGWKAEPWQPPEPDLAPSSDLLTCTGLRFGYPDMRDPLISNLDLHLKAGEWVGVVGESGSGKSTLVDLLIGQLHASAGRIRWKSVEGARPGIGYAGATTALIPGSLRDNIDLLAARWDDQQLSAALNIVGIDHLVKRWPAGLDTPVDAFDQRISSGERQRIGLARALLHASDLLILDEATAPLDQLTEARFLSGLRAARPELTVLLITHRLAALQHTDRDLLLVNGALSPFTDDQQSRHASDLSAEQDQAPCT